MSNYVQFPSQPTTAVISGSQRNSPSGGSAYMSPATPAQAIQPGSVTYTTTYDSQGQARYHPFVAKRVDFQTESGLLTGIQWVPATKEQAAAAAHAGIPTVSPAQLQQAASVSQSILANVAGGASALAAAGGSSSHPAQPATSMPGAPPPPDLNGMSQREADKAMKAWDKQIKKYEKEVAKEAARLKAKQEEADKERMKALAKETERQRRMSGGVSFDRERERRMSASGAAARAMELERQLAEMKIRDRDKDREREREAERSRLRERKLSGGVLGLSRDRSQPATRRVSVSEVDRARRLSGNYDAARPSWYPATTGGGAAAAAAAYATPAPTTPGYPYSQSTGLGTWNPGTSPNAFPQAGLPLTHSPSRMPVALASHSPYHPPSKQPSPHGSGGHSPFVASPGSVYPPGHVLAGQAVAGASPAPVTAGFGAPVYGGQAAQAVAFPQHVAYPSPTPAAAQVATPWGQQVVAQPQTRSAKSVASSLPFPPFEPFLVIGNLDDLFAGPMPLLPSSFVPHDVGHESWIQFWTAIIHTWSERSPNRRVKHAASNVADIVEHWNQTFFFPRLIEAVLFHGRERQTGPHVGKIEDAIPFPTFRGQDDDSSSSDSSSSESSDDDPPSHRYSGAQMEAIRQQREELRRQKKKEKRRKKKERRRRREEELPFSLGFFNVNARPTHAHAHAHAHSHSHSHSHSHIASSSYPSRPY